MMKTEKELGIIICFLILIIYIIYLQTKIEYLEEKYIECPKNQYGELYGDREMNNSEDCSIDNSCPK